MVTNVHWKQHTRVIIAAVGDRQKLGTIQMPRDKGLEKYTRNDGIAV